MKVYPEVKVVLETEIKVVPEPDFIQNETEKHSQKSTKDVIQNPFQNKPGTAPVGTKMNARLKRKQRREQIASQMGLEYHEPRNQSPNESVGQASF